MSQRNRLAENGCFLDTLNIIRSMPGLFRVMPLRPQEKAAFVNLGLTDSSETSILKSVTRYQAHSTAAAFSTQTPLECFSLCLFSLEKNCPHEATLLLKQTRGQLNPVQYWEIARCTTHLPILTKVTRFLYKARHPLVIASLEHLILEAFRQKVYKVALSALILTYHTSPGSIQEQAQLLKQLGFAYAKLEQWEQANTAFRLSLALYQQDCRAQVADIVSLLLDIAVACLCLSRLKEALSFCCEAKRVLFPGESSRLYQLLGLIYWQLSRYSDATAAYNRALDFPDSNRQEIFFSLSLIEYMQGSLHNALNLLHQAEFNENEDGGNSEHSRRFCLFQAIYNAKKSEVWLSRALSGGKTDTLARLCVAAILVHGEKFGEAEALLATTTPLSAWTRSIHLFLLGTIHARCSRYQLAVATYSQALECNQLAAIPLRLLHCASIVLLYERELITAIQIAEAGLLVACECSQHYCMKFVPIFGALFFKLDYDGFSFEPRVGLVEAQAIYRHFIATFWDLLQNPMLNSDFIIYPGTALCTYLLYPSGKPVSMIRELEQITIANHPLLYLVKGFTYMHTRKRAAKQIFTELLQTLPEELKEFRDLSSLGLSIVSTLQCDIKSSFCVVQGLLPQSLQSGYFDLIPTFLVSSVDERTEPLEALKAQTMLGWAVWMLQQLHKDKPRLLANYLHAIAIAKCTGSYKQLMYPLLHEVLRCLEQAEEFGELFYQVTMQLESLY